MAVTGVSASTPPSTEPTPEELLAQIKALQAQVERLQESQDRNASQAETNPSTKQEALETVLAEEDDRKQRPTFLQAVGTDSPGPFAGFAEGKFFLGDVDGNFFFNPNLQIQARHVANYSDAGNDTDFGWEMRRVKAGASGHIYTPELEYSVTFGFSRGSTSIALENANIQYSPEDGLFGVEHTSFLVGQFKDPTFFEEKTSSKRQLAADRSYANERLAGGLTDFVQGIQYLYNDGRIAWQVGYLDGANTDQTSFIDPAGTSFFFALNGRFDILLKGENARVFRDFTALNTEEDSLRAGAGFLVDLGDNDPGSFLYDLFATADISYETASGFGFFGAGMLRAFDNSGVEFIDLGFVTKASQIIDRDKGLEGFGQISAVFLENDDPRSGEQFMPEIVGGINKYWEGHNVKMTIDAGVLPNGSGVGNFTGIGYRGFSGNDLEFTVRGQIQLLI
ncbi:MAG: FlxA-like family protein [Planctomycetota bacterium]